MALKRKRSSPSISPGSVPHGFSSPASPVIYTGLSPSPSPNPFPQSHNHDISMSNCHPSDCPSLYEDSRPHLHSRTRKRVRNKPDETSIHGTHKHSHLRQQANRKLEKTYQILFAAANSPPPPPPPPSIPAPSIPSRSPTSHRQPSLHAFWNLPTPPPSAPRTPAPPSPSLNRPACQDCDAPLLSSSDTDICMGGMDDAIDEWEFSCRVCAKLVCETCAVVEVGTGRECLSCKTRVSRRGGTTWVGGIGWMP